MGDRSFDYPTGQYSNSRGYELSGKIMLTAIIVLFFIVFLMVCFHLYLRCYVLRTRRHHSRTRRRTRRTNLVFYVDNNSGGGGAQSRGLDAAVLKSLPVFVFSGETRPEEPLECAVCLSEFEENETGRTLPKCNHSFHIGCIDMWFDSHSTCPLCRSAVEPADSRAEFSVSVAEPDPVEPGSGSGCPGCDSGSAVATTSFGKPGEIQIPVRDKIFATSEEESPAAASTQSFRSPVSRMMSFKRILSRDRRGPASPSSSCGAAAEPDIECGGAEEARRA